MFYETRSHNHGLPHDPLKALVGPRPIGWISAMSAAGEVNLSPYSFFNAISERPFMVAFSSTGYKDAISFIEETREFVCNLATWDLRDAVNLSSAAPAARGRDEMPYSGVTAGTIRAGQATPGRRGARSSRVQVAARRCRSTVSTASRPAITSSMGQVVGVHIDDRFIVDGLVETAAMRPIMRAGYHDYFVATPETRFSLIRPTGV